MIRILTLIGALLVTAIAAEALLPADRAVPSAVPATTHPLAVRTRPADTADAARSTWLSDVLSRPLFAPDRRPDTGAVAADPGLPRLSGIIGTPEGTVAIFQPTADGKPVLARNGDRIGGWQVATVAADGVTLLKGGARVVLSPRFSTAAQTTPGPRPLLLPNRR